MSFALCCCCASPPPPRAEVRRKSKHGKARHTRADVLRKLEELSSSAGRGHSVAAAAALPADPTGLAEFSMRMFSVASGGNNEEEAFLTQAQFEALEHQLPYAITRSAVHHRAAHFTFRYRKAAASRARMVAWQLPPLVTRSVEAEITCNKGGQYRDAYKYVATSKASARYLLDPQTGSPERDAKNRRIIFDEGHDFLCLSDFIARARSRGVMLNEAEACVLRLYTWQMGDMWHAALCGVDAESGEPDGGAGLRDWATCLAVLLSALAKLSARCGGGDAAKALGRHSKRSSNVPIHHHTFTGALTRAQAWRRCLASLPRPQTKAN